MTPIGHSLAGYAVYSFSVSATNRNRLKLASLCIFMATAADLDFLPGILMGRPDLYHHGITHSLGFALMASLVIAGIFSIKMKPFSRIFSLCLISYLSHIVIDFFGYSSSHRHPPGMPLFWPISGEHFISPVRLYLRIHYNSSPSARMAQEYA
jgi:inner membrane protein